MGGYLELARKAATREERPETAESQTPKGGIAYPPISQSTTTLAHESCEEPNSPVRRRDKSDISDQSSDYRAVVEVLRDPPYWLRDAYMAGYRRGTVSLHALSAAVAAALGRSPYVWTERLMPLVRQALGSKDLPRDRTPDSTLGFESAAKGRG